MPHRRLAAPALVAVLLAFCLGACIISRGVEVSRLTTIRGDSAVVNNPVKVHLVDGSVAVFRSGVVVAHDRAVGGGWKYSPTLRESTYVSVVPLDSVIGMEAFNTRYDAGRTIMYSTIATGAVLLGSVAAICASDPKCFGSCPTFYSDSAGMLVLEAEGFSYSISPLLEARDVDRLRVQPDSTGLLRLEVRNEALETHYINQLELVEAVNGPGEMVLPDERARPVAVRDLAPPTTVTDRAGRDVRPFVVAAGDSQVFMTDRGTLARASSADPLDYLDLTFPRRPGSDSIAVVLRLRNSLLNTVLFYDFMLAAPGARSIDWMAHDLQRIGPTLELGRWYASHLGLRIYTEDRGAWTEVTRLSDYGPIAWRDVAAIVPAPTGDSVHLRLAFVADQWRIDRIAIGDGVRRPRTRTVSLAAVTNAEGDLEPRAREDLLRADDRYLETTPPQRFTISFDVGRGPNDSTRTFFIASQGYYTEWVRGSWLAGAHDLSTFTPGDAALDRVLRSWARQRDTLEKRFYRTRIPVR
jgi:hypothetical protein